MKSIYKLIILWVIFILSFDSLKAYELFGCGKNDRNQLGIEPRLDIVSKIAKSVADKNWVDISSGSSHSMGLKEDSTLWVWGANSFGVLGDTNKNYTSKPIKISNFNDWTNISAGQEHFTGIRNNGTLWYWGTKIVHFEDYFVQIPILYPTQCGNDSNWAHVESGYNFYFALKKDGTLWGYGNTDDYSFGDRYNVSIGPVKISNDRNWQQISIKYIQLIALKKNGTIWAMSQDINTPKILKQVGKDSNFIYISAGKFRNYAIQRNGTLWGWGYLDKNKLTPEPIQIGVDRNWTEVHCGGNFVVCKKNDGSLWGLGENFNGQFGNDSLNDFNKPVLISKYPVWTKIAPGMEYLMLLRDYKLCNLPKINTKSIIEIKLNSAISGGEIIEDGNTDIIEKGICWSSRLNPTINDNFKSAGSGIENFDCQLTNLVQNTRYYLRAYAKNDIGISYGNEVTFTTKIGVPIPNLPVNNSEDVITSPQLAWEEVKGIVMYKVQLSLDSLFTSNLLNTNVVGYNTILNGLKPKTKYFWRVAAIDNNNEGYWSQINNFTTGIKSSIDNIFEGNLYLNLYPNPFNDEIILEFNSTESNFTTVKIMDLSGNLIDIIFEGNLNIGLNSIHYKPYNISAGKYYVQICQENKIINKEIIYIK